MTADGIQIERGEHDQEFVIIGNSEARDTRLSFRARGLHHHLLSLPPGWRVTTTELAKGNPEGRDAIRTALNELIDLQYVMKERRQDARGRWSTVMTVYGRPQPKTDSQASVTEDGFPGVGKPGVGKSGAKDLKTVTENGEDQKMASRRAHASGASASWTIDRVVRDVREAVALVHGDREAEELSDGEVLGLFYTYVKGARPRDLVAYAVKIIGSAPYLETFMQNVEPTCTKCAQWESVCECPASAAA